MTPCCAQAILRPYSNSRDNYYVEFCNVLHCESTLLFAGQGVQILLLGNPQWPSFDIACRALCTPGGV